jgi:4-hydroxy-4-methyl-2-oxoglutarate aldolase
VVPRAELPQALAAARARADKEAANRKRFLAGEVGLDVYGMRERLAQKGLTYVDHISELGGER